VEYTCSSATLCTILY